MSRVNVPLWQSAGKVTVETAATLGATIGTDVVNADGSLFVPVTLLDLQALIPEVSVTVWSLIQEIPANVSALAAAAGTGLFAVTGTGAGAFRSVVADAGGSSVVVANGSGVAGDPALKLDGDAATPGATQYYGTDAGGAKGFYALPSGGGMAWLAVSAAVNPVADQTGYLVDASGGTVALTLPASAAAGFVVAANADGGAVRIVSNGNAIDGVPGGDDLLLADGEAVQLAASASGVFEVVWFKVVNVSGPAEAADVGYDNAGSGLSATDVQAALDELAASSGGGADPATAWEEVHDFVGAQNFEFNLATGASFSGATAGHPGTITCTSGGSTSGSFAFTRSAATATASPQIVLGGGELTFEALFEVPALIAGVNTGQLRLGFLDELSGAPENGVHLQYENGVANWKLYTRAAGVANSITGGTAVTTGWHYAKIVINAAGTSAELFIDGVSQGTIATGFPTVGMTFGGGIQKSAGTTPFILVTDLIRVRQTFTSPRF